jgi:hypothetical protein
MKIVYLDENHWIELSKAVHGRVSSPETLAVLEVLRQARALGRACFPLSYGHYLETRKHSNAQGRQRLARLMVELSGGMTITPPTIVVCHEIEVALGRCFPGRVVPRPFYLLGKRAAHAAANPDLDFPLEWPPEAEAMSVFLRAVEEGRRREPAELAYLSGNAQAGEPQVWGPLTNQCAERQFGADLAGWAGAASQYSPAELKREIYITNLSEIEPYLQVTLAHHHIPYEEFAQLSESQRWALLDEMPWQRAEMHLKRQWAKEANRKPSERHSDLNDWGYLSLAVSYCDVVVTEKDVASRYTKDGFKTYATIRTQLIQLPELLG